MGRPSKGHRIRVVTRVDPATHLVIAREAAKENLSMSEWLAKLIGAAIAPKFIDGRHECKVPT